MARMLDIVWSQTASADLTRLYNFLAPKNQLAAARLIDQLTLAPERLREHPRLGLQLEQFPSQEVRRILVGNYEIRYEIRPADILILSIWHGREDRL